ncbi:MAG: hypothetical protein ACU84Q_19100 [Gammaproteobacteria bacterium]
MQKTKILVIAALSILLAACGGDKGSATDAASKAADKAMDAASEAADKAMDAASGAADKAMDAASEAASSAVEAVKVSAGDAVSYVDHSKDEIEFQLKSSIDGWKSLLEDVKDSDEVAKIKEHIAALEKQLNAL